MTVARISVIHTSSDLLSTAANKRIELERLLDALEDHFSQQPGYIMGFRFGGVEDEHQLGRIALWRDHRDADHAATMEHTVALRSQIHRLIDPGHMEILVEVRGNPKNLPVPLGS